MLDREIPARVVEYCRRCIPTPPDEPRGTHFEQKGEIRLGQGKPWLPFTAEQTCDAVRPGFVWHARVTMAPLMTCVVEDAFQDGHGRLDAKVLGLVPVAHARGPEIDRGEMQRYLAELVWCPMAFLHNPELRYREQPDGTVRVWVGEESTYVDFTFDDAGNIVRAFTTTRVRGDLAAAQPWEGRFFDDRDFGGIRAPARAEVGWHTPEGPYLYWRGEITSMVWAK